MLLGASLSGCHSCRCILKGDPGRVFGMHLLNHSRSFAASVEGDLMPQILPKALAGVIILGILSVVLGSWYTIDEGERGVVLRYGAVSGVAQPGLGFKIPVIDSIVRISVQSKAAIYNSMEAYSRDQQPATMNLSVNYRIPPDRVEEVYATYGGEDGLLSRLVERRVFEESKTVFGKVTAVEAIQE